MVTSQPEAQCPLASISHFPRQSIFLPHRHTTMESGNQHEHTLHWLLGSHSNCVKRPQNARYGHRLQFRIAERPCVTLLHLLHFPRPPPALSDWTAVRITGCSSVSSPSSWLCLMPSDPSGYERGQESHGRGAASPPAGQQLLPGLGLAHGQHCSFSPQLVCAWVCAYVCVYV